MMLVTYLGIAQQATCGAEGGGLTKQTGQNVNNRKTRIQNAQQLVFVLQLFATFKQFPEKM